MARPGLRVAIVVAVLVGGCSTDPSPDATPPTAVAQGKGFVLAMAVPTDHFAVGQAIDVRTTLAWTGPAPNVTIWGSGSGPVWFSFEELTGRHRKMGGVLTADCAPHPFAKGISVVPLIKSGAWSGDDPDAAFFQEFVRDPQLHLPPGRWRISADLSGSLAQCAPDVLGVSLQAVIEIGVG